MKKVKRVLSVLLAVFLLAGLSGCKPAAPSEDEIMQDIIHSSAYYFDKDSSIIDEFIIESRQTRAEDYEDTVYVLMKVRDEEKSAQLGFIVNYALYNDGWKLENITPDMASAWNYTPLQGPSEETVRGCIPANAVEISTEIYLEENRSTVDYSIVNDMGYCIKTETYEQIIVFNTDAGTWTPAGSGIIGSQNDFSPIIGTEWQYLEGSNGARLEFDNIDPVTLEATGTLQVMVVLGSGTLYGNSQYEKDLSKGFFRFEGESLIMGDYADDDSKYKHLEFRHEGGGNFSVIVSPRDGFAMRRPDYYLERVG